MEDDKKILLETVNNFISVLRIQSQELLEKAENKEITNDDLFAFENSVRTFLMLVRNSITLESYKNGRATGCNQ